MSALKNAVKGAARATAKVATPGLGGFTRGSIDELLFKLSKSPNDPALKQAIIQAAGSNPALIQKIRPFGLGPAANGAKPATPGILGTIKANPGKAAIGAGLPLAGIGAIGLMGSRGNTGPNVNPQAVEEEEEPTDFAGQMYGDSSFNPTKIAPQRSPMMSGVAGRGRSIPSKPQSALTGINGAGDMSDLGDVDFGTDDVNFEDMFRADFEKPIPQAPQQKQGGGFMNALKQFGPLLAALVAGKMMK